jgi:NSS family neurotransmitter:Na+ symporter
MSDAGRESWASRIGFILAAVGSAVGLGNLWQFPFKTAANGGAAFLVIYLLAVLAIGFPAVLAEFVVGRGTHRDVVSAFAQMGGDRWKYVGALGLGVGFWILSYYSVVGGWVIRYVWGSLTGAYFGDPQAYFGAIASGPDALAFHALFMLLTAGIVAAGVEDGIERATKLMVPGIVVLLVGIGAWAATLPGAAAGYEYFLSPDLTALRRNFWSILPFAVSQAFFSLSLGMGIMVTYASYIDRDANLGEDGVVIVLLNTAVGVLAGLVVFPLLFTRGIEPGTGGASALFVALATAFAQLPLGRVVGALFFLVVLVAALSSSISLLESLTARLIDAYGIDRKPGAVALAGALFVLGIPSALRLAWLNWFDGLAYGVFLPVSVLLVLLFVGWVIGEEAVAELREGVEGGATLGGVWLWTVRTLVLAGVVVALAAGALELAASGGWVPPI